MFPFQCFERHGFLISQLKKMKGTNRKDSTELSSYEADPPNKCSSWNVEYFSGNVSEKDVLTENKGNNCYF